MPLPGTYNITDLIIGNTWKHAFIIKSDPNTPINLSGAVLVFRCFAKGATGNIRKATSDPKEYWAGDNTNLLSGFVITNPAAGECLLAFKPLETRKLAGASSIPYEIEIRRSGEEQTILRGNILPTGGVNDDV